MPIKEAAIKALRQTKRRSLANARIKRVIKNRIKDTQKVIDTGKVEEALKTMKAAVKAIDKAVSKKVITKNTGGRRKSRIMKRINTLSKSK